jgi:hypothetical protein
VLTRRAREFEVEIFASPDIAGFEATLRRAEAVLEFSRND